ncbi:MAG: tRNA pseudouridine(55) synthase TruB [Methylovulum sp.]|uniref:tRNA pseudouridine(55) synthase TruB n=1 Tax=Methylovulum sp. TaxID=1916980 RepID=UPI002629781C|nr:tRNA pseudouridine(55) synthase TruB [Methylovulum sp.]MDD2724387.1 tRNA pseudouridine(55) synthase TruB [Methylovulum sp.]MDD5124215.1 tRNA pseudouridine(55) synthase TruB [Methylovulum sp.]
MSKRTSDRNVHGIILLDKRLGVSSNKALQEVRRLFNANKAGHTGALDPLASGLLPLCFGEATKVSALMLDDDKRYQVTVQLGVMTDTGDAEGKVVDTKPVPALTLSDIEACLQKFTGAIEQVPPMYSALKHQGKKLYELAREGISIERKARNIHIYGLTLLSHTADQLDLDVSCSKGTYIRSLAEDIGHALGTCGTVTALRRLGAGQFSISEAKTLETLAAMDEQTLFNTLIPVDKPLSALPAVYLSDAQTIAINYGQAIHFENAGLGTVRLYHETLFLGLGEMLLDGKIAPRKLFNMNK